MRRLALLVGIGFFGACSEYQVHKPDKEPPDDPPESTVGEEGSPPDWTSCTEGWTGTYFNLPADHPDVVAWGVEDTGAPDTGGGDTGAPEVDWFEDGYRSFQRHDAHLEPGIGWFPVDEDLAGDPEFFAVQWRAWVRPEDNGSHDFVVGSTGPLEIEVNGEVVFRTDGTPGLESEVVALELAAGQKPITVRYAHLGGDSGLRFRSLSDDVDVCPPE